jgi:hypothetical protein
VARLRIVPNNPQNNSHLRIVQNNPQRTIRKVYNPQEQSAEQSAKSIGWLANEKLFFGDYTYKFRACSATFSDNPGSC